MARVTALSLRAAAREAMLAAGGRGFMRFLPPGGALLATDAIRRCSGEEERMALQDALAQAGFACRECSGLLHLSPADEVLSGITGHGNGAVDWESPMHPAQALALRWVQRGKRPLTDDGRQLIMEALRISWAAEDPGELKALRAQAAVMLRQGDVSGFHESGVIVFEWCNSMCGGNADEA